MKATIPTLVQNLGTGRRKLAIARVFLRPGKGTITVNSRVFEEYFKTESSRTLAKQSLVGSELADKFDVLCTVMGGGIMGQAGAVRLGVARALIDYNAELRPRLKQLGCLTRDPRAHERKKPGQKGARKKFQFSKR